MVIFYQNNEKFKTTLIKLLELHQRLHKDLYEKDLFTFLLDAEEKLGIDIKIEPEVNLMKARPNRGWKWSTLRCFTSSDDYCLNLPETEILATKHEVDETFKAEPEEDLIQISKPELLRELKALDIQLSKVIKKVEGGTW